MRHRKLAINGSLVAAVAVLATLGYFTVTGSSATTPTGVRTAAVTQGDVSAAVSATGNVTSAMNLGVSFTDCTGSLTAIDVKPGQVVTAGQALATVDPGKAQTALNNAQAQLAAVAPADYTGDATIGDAVLAAPRSAGALVVSPAVYTQAPGASSQRTSDEAALIAAQLAYKADSSTSSALNKAVGKAQATVSADLAAVDGARSKLAAEQNTSPADPQAVAAAQSELAQTQQQLVTDESTLNSTELLLTQTLTYDQRSIVYWQAQVTYDEGQGPAPSTPAPVAPSGTSGSASGSGAKASVPAPASGSAGGASASGSSLGTSKAASGGTSSAGTGTPGGGMSGTGTPSQTALNNAQQSVVAAQQTLTDCTLTAPVGGTVITVNGVVGAPPTGSSSGSSSAGSGSSGAGGGASGGASGPTASSTSSSGGFISLSDLGQLQIKGAFSETDVSDVHAGQHATVVFPALTDADDPAGITASGTVAGVDLSSVTTNNVVTYGVTVSLRSPSPRIKLGETGNVTVTTATQSGVLTVPTNAITALGPRKTVTVQNGSANQITPVQVGIAGNGLTQITSGVSEGQKLVLPSATPSTSSSGGFPRGGGAGGAGGIAGRLGGGS